MISFAVIRRSGSHTHYDRFVDALRILMLSADEDGETRRVKHFGGFAGGGRRGHVLMLSRILNGRFQKSHLSFASHFGLENQRSVSDTPLVLREIQPR